MKQETIEQKVSRAILEKPVGEIEIEGRVYQIAPPSIATLIEVSEVVSTLPIVESVAQEKVFITSLRYAKGFRPLGDIAAILILGAKNLKETKTIRTRKKKFGIPYGWREETKEIDRKAELSKLILENVRPTVLFDCVVKRLQDMEITSFFAIITSLAGANLIEPTKRDN